VEFLLFLLEYDAHVTLGDTVGAQHLHQGVVVESLKRAPVVLPRAWLCQVDRLRAVPWLVIIALTLLTVGVTNVVSVLLFELVGVDVALAGEF